MSTAREAVAAEPRRLRRAPALRAVTRTWSGRIGLLMTLVVVTLAFVGPYVTSTDPAQTFGIPGAPPSPDHVLGLDTIGRDVLTRLLHGGRSTLALALATTLLIYSLGVPLGLMAGMLGGWIDSVMMRAVDVLLSLPGLLVILLLCTGLGNSRGVIVCATALVLVPGVVRIARTAALEVSTTGYVEAAIARGEPTASMLWREVLPNVRATLIADLGVRFSWAVILIGSINFLGVGLEPPTADWGLMVSENRGVMASDPWSVAGPALVLGVLIVGLNLVGDAYTRSSDHSSEA